MDEQRINDDRGSILIVDDSIEQLDILSDALKESGYRVRAASGGNLALQSVFNNPPDLILLDIVMPGMDGYEICRRLKENETTKDIPLIFVTGKDMVYDEEKGFSLGAVDYITKPVNLSVLKARVNTHIQLKLHMERLE